MAKTKFYYNSHTLKYEKVKANIWNKVLKLTGFLSCAFVFATLLLFLGFTYLDSPKEKELERELSRMTLQYDIMQNRLQKLDVALQDIQERDRSEERRVGKESRWRGTAYEERRT